MVTYLDCIERIGKVSDKIIDNFDITFKQLDEKIAGKKYNQIIFIGSGSSFNVMTCAKGFVEKVTKTQVLTYLPNDFLHNTFAYNKDALYIFISQTGTSTLTLDCVDVVKNLGCITVGITGFNDTPLAQKTDVFVDQGVGKEEYPMVTIGFSSCLLTTMLLGLKLGKLFGNLSNEEFEGYISDARKLPTNYQNIIDKTNAWFDKNKEKMLKSRVFTFYSGNNMYGIAREATLKLCEVSKMTLSCAWEIDDGMHGPTMGYQSDNCVIVLNDGGINANKYRDLMRWSKAELNNGFMIGLNPLDETDLEFETVTGDFNLIEFAGAIQVLADRLAEDMGVVISDLSRHKENLYFNTHNEDLTAKFMDSLKQNN